MQQQRPGGSFEEMAAWLEDREHRLRMLEAENQELRRQLADLRRGVGVALVIEGRTLPVTPLPPTAAHSGVVPALAPGAAELRPGQIDRWGMSDAGVPYSSSGPVPTPARSAAPTFAGAAQSWPGATPPQVAAPPQSGHMSARPRVGQHPSWPPASTASSTAQRPVVRPLSSLPVPQAHAAWLNGGREWPEQTAPRRANPPASSAPSSSLPGPLAPLGRRPAARLGALDPAAQDVREWQAGERNPFADSFLL